MFNFFKKNNITQRSIKDWEYNLLKDIVNNLPTRYSFLHNQINNDFFIDSIDNEILKDNWKRVILNQNLYKNYQDKKFNYVIKDVRVFDLINNSYTSVDIDIFEGIIIGYKIHSSSNSFDANRIDYLRIKEVKYENQYAELNNVLSNYEIKLLEKKGYTNCYKIELEEGEFYNFLELENGDLAALDKKCDLYLLIHDPYTITFFCTKEEIFEKIKYETLESEILIRYQENFN